MDGELEKRGIDQIRGSFKGEMRKREYVWGKQTNSDKSDKWSNDSLARGDPQLDTARDSVPCFALYIRELRGQVSKKCPLLKSP